MREIGLEIVAAARRDALDEVQPDGDHEFAWEVACGTIQAFSKLHPEVCLPFTTWQDLREEIERAVLDLEPLHIMNAKKLI